VRRKGVQILGLIAIAIAALVGLTYILQQHAQQAESYPPFSSYRTLPEGTSVLYDALGRTAGMTAQRNTQPLGTIHFNNAALLLLDVELYSLSGNGQWFSEMEELAAKGNRVIVGLVPHRNRFIQPENDRQSGALKRWSIRLAFTRATDIRDEEDERMVAGWPMYFAESGGWSVVREENGKAVVVERVQGKGSIVLLANPFLLSNAAMVDDRQTTFLAKVIGPMHLVVFDETHFGIEETGSIAALARRYHLQGLLLGLVITSALFIWKSAAGFPPSSGGPKPAQSLMGEDSSAAFLNLLRRNIKTDEVLPTCVQAWGRMYQRKAGASLAEAIDLAESGSGTPSRTYSQIQQVLSRIGRLRPDGAKPNQS